MTVRTSSHTPPPIKLRGHHFLCLLTYKGLGYTPAFVENLSAVAEAITAGRSVVLTEGPDDICNALTAKDRIACDHDCGRAETRGIDKLALEAVAPVIGANLAASFILTTDMVARLRHAFTEGSIRAACQQCRWKGICDEIAESGFEATRLFPDR